MRYETLQPDCQRFSTFWHATVFKLPLLMRFNEYRVPVICTGFRFCAHWVSDVLHREGGGGNLISNIITVILAWHQQLLLCLVRLFALVIGWTKTRLLFLSIFPFCVPSRYLLFVSCFSEISFICSTCPSCTPSIVKSPSVWAVCIWTRLCLLCGLSDQRWVWVWIHSSLILTLLTTCTQCIQWDMGWAILVSF